MVRTFCPAWGTGGFRERLLQRFAQAAAIDAHAKGGTGLGFAIAHVIIARLGGRIGFDTAGGQGTPFGLERPCSDQAA